MESLGDRMKAIEAQYEMNVEPYYPFILRLDGKNFSKFTKGFKPPFDNNFVVAMMKTMNDLLDKYNARTGYTHSDEITLIFAPVCTKEEYDINPEKFTHIFNGRVVKMCTVAAGYCSTRFSHHIHNIIQSCKDGYKSDFVDKIANFQTCFDCRMLGFKDNIGEIVNHMIWRSTRDCYRNCVSTYAQHYIGKKKIHGMHSDQMIEKMKETGLDWEKDVPCFLKFGIYAKKELFEKECMDLKTGKKVMATRSRIINFNLKIYYDDSILELLLDKYFLGDHSRYTGLSKVEL